MTKKTTKSTTRKAQGSLTNAAPASGQGPVQTNSPADTKIGTVIRLLRQESGASLDELVAATSWQSHTTRAALTGLRKKGHLITKEKVEGATRYSIQTAVLES